MSEERSYERDLNILNSATPFPWHYQENNDCWQLFGGYSGHMQLIKAPKHGTDYAEYWPEPEDAELLVNAPEAWRYWMEKSQRQEEEINRLRKGLKRAAEDFKDIVNSASHYNAVLEMSHRSRNQIRRSLGE